MGKFEWDPNKNASNKKKHGVSFLQATEAFDDLDKVSKIDKRFTDEVRELTVGKSPSADKLLQVAHTKRGDKTRIISAFPTNKKGKRWYNFNKSKYRI